MNEVSIIQLLVCLLIIGTILNFLLPLAVAYLASVIKRRFGKDYTDKYLESAEIGVMGSEQYFHTSTGEVTHKDKKDLSMDIAKKILAKDGILIKSRDDEDLLSDIIESVVFKLNRKKETKEK
ncbi:MAG: phage holin, LLH family [Nitrospirota bacterium]